MVERDVDDTVGLQGVWRRRCRLLELGIMYNYGL